jgi:hypothetical protein
MGEESHEHRTRIRLVRAGQAYAAEHTDEPRQRDIWIKLADLWKAAALAAEIADHTVIPVAALAGCKGPGGTGK